MASDGWFSDASVEYTHMENLGLPHFMRCVASPVRGIAVKAGIYSPVISIDGCAPNRNAIIVDCWGAAQSIYEREDGRWLLTMASDGPVAEFVPAPDPRRAAVGPTEWAMHPTP